MLVSKVSRSVRRSGLIALAVATCTLSISPTRAAGGTLKFHATVSGKAHDVGGFSQSIKSPPAGKPLLATLFVGCGIVKSSLAGSPPTYELQVRTDGAALAGMQPTEPGVYLSIDHFRLNASRSTYKKADVNGTFAINGHAYGDGSIKLESVAVVSKGGLSGTWTDTAAVRDYPAKGGTSVSGFKFRATWQCTSLLHITQK